MLDVAWYGSQSGVYLGPVFVSPEGESVSLSEWGRQIAICSKSPEGIFSPKTLLYSALDGLNSPPSPTIQVLTFLVPLSQVSTLLLTLYSSHSF